MNISWEWQTWSAGRARSTVVRVVWRAKPEQHRRCLFFFTLHPYNAGAIRPHRDSGTIFPRPRVSWPAADKRTQVCQADSMSVARADVLAIKDSVTARPYHPFSRSMLFFSSLPLITFAMVQSFEEFRKTPSTAPKNIPGRLPGPRLGAKFRFPVPMLGCLVPLDAQTSRSHTTPTRFAKLTGPDYRLMMGKRTPGYPILTSS